MVPQSRIETARKALDMINDRIFCCELEVYDDDEIVKWCENTFELTFTKKQLWCLISQKSMQSIVFEGLDMEVVDTEEMLEEMSKVEFCYNSDDEDDDLWYTGDINGIDEYVNEWVNLLNKIIIGVVVDSNLTEWVEKIEDEFYI